MFLKQKIFYSSKTLENKKKDNFKTKIFVSKKELLLHAKLHSKQINYNGAERSDAKAVGRHTFTYTKSWLSRSWLSRSWLSRS